MVGWSASDKKKKKKLKSSSRTVGTNATFAAATGQVAPASATTTGTDTQIKTGNMQQRQYVAPNVEELGDDE
ncbi:hypothetical protein E4U54_001073 [Claviceps lovelessii]|nr:hypothetical protein E4U54_001073 [Claviceps lovelessii]